MGGGGVCTVYTWWVWWHPQIQRDANIGVELDRFVLQVSEILESTGPLPMNTPPLVVSSNHACQRAVRLSTLSTLNLLPSSSADPDAIDCSDGGDGGGTAAVAATTAILRNADP